MYINRTRLIIQDKGESQSIAYKCLICGSTRTYFVGSASCCRLDVDFSWSQVNINFYRWEHEQESLFQN